LGIELTRTLRWKPFKERILEKARRNMYKTWAMGISSGFLGVKTSDVVWRSVVRSTMEYGCEVWGGDGVFHTFVTSRNGKEDSEAWTKNE